MTTLTSLDLATVTGGASSTKSSGSSLDPQSGLARAAQEKPGKNSIDIFAQGATDGSASVGVEARRRLNTNTSIFGQVKGGVDSTGAPSGSVMGGIRFEW
ncbi:MAG: hypothetical protein QM831_41355 [Kofleriaceae bacterium]